MKTHNYNTIYSLYKYSGYICIVIKFIVFEYNKNKWVIYMENQGRVIMNIENLLKEKNISKNKICKDLDISRYNFNKYCRNEFQRIDAYLICKLCYYLDCPIDEILIYVKPKEK